MQLKTTIRKTFTAQTPIGTMTTLGKLVSFNALGYAFFQSKSRDGGRILDSWSGPAAFDFIQILD